MSSNIYQKWAAAESRRKLKLRMVEYLGGSCVQCGYSKCVEAMDFHHRDPKEKDFQLASGVYRRWEVIREELDKCMLLCARCHREIHAELREVQLEQQRIEARKLVPEKQRALNVRCSVCHEAFVVWPSKMRLGVTCSVECAAKAQEKVVWPSDDDLHRLVWLMPVMKLSTSLGVSDSAVKKRCRKRGISTPGRGYWAKQKACP